MYQAAEAGGGDFETWLADGILHAKMTEEANLVVQSPTVTLDIEPPQIVDPDTAEQKREQGSVEDLTEAELGYTLWLAGEQLDGLEELGMPFAAFAEFASRIEEGRYLKYAAQPLDEES